MLVLKDEILRHLADQTIQWTLDRLVARVGKHVRPEQARRRFCSTRHYRAGTLASISFEESLLVGARQVINGILRDMVRRGYATIRFGENNDKLYFPVNSGELIGATDSCSGSSHTRRVKQRAREL